MDELDREIEAKQDLLWAITEELEGDLIPMRDERFKLNEMYTTPSLMDPITSHLSYRKFIDRIASDKIVWGMANLQGEKGIHEWGLHYPIVVAEEELVFEEREDDGET